MNPLDQLHDITLPAPVAAFPWAWGWWALIVCAIALLVTLTWWLRRRQQQLRYGRQAQQQLQQLDQSCADYGAQVQQLLKQTLLAYQQRDTIAALNGEQWHQLLNRYHSAPWEQLIGNPYQAENSHGGEALHQAAQQAITNIAKEGKHA